MKADKNHINYSTDYLQKYLKGELTDKEMQALEKDALEDPFLSDAIDGLSEAANHSPSFESGVADLQNRLRQRIREQERKRSFVFMFPRWQVAASIVVLAAATALTISLLKQKSVQKTMSAVTKKDTQQVSIQPAPLVVQNDSDRIKIENKMKFPAPTPVAQSDERDKGIVATRHQPSASSSDYKKTKQQDSIHYVQGLVLDDSGKAIESAIVHLSGEDKATATDSNGYFKLYLNKEKKNQEIAINSLGFKSVKASVPADSSIYRYQMQNTPGQLNEVVVQGYGSQKRTDVTGAVTVVTNENVHPEGWQTLIRYINENKKINNTDSLLKGEEIISFVVNKKGKLSSIKIIKSISASHDAEIIRLLKTGPSLQPAADKKQKCQISILFN